MARSDITLGQLLADYMVAPCRNPQSQTDKAESNFRLYLSPWANRRLSQIRKDEVGHCTPDSVGAGQVTANIAVKLLRALFNKAIEWEIWSKPNPATGITSFREHSRERFLQPDELPRLFRALADEKNETIRDYVLMSLLTGARRSNVLAMRWEQVNIDRREWRIPKTKIDGTACRPAIAGNYSTFEAAPGVGGGSSEGSGKESHPIPMRGGSRRRSMCSMPSRRKHGRHPWPISSLPAHVTGPCSRKGSNYDRKTKMTRGSGNVFHYVGFAPAEAENLQLRAQLMSRIRDVARGMTQREAAKQLGLAQPRLNDLLRGRSTSS